MERSIWKKQRSVCPDVLHDLKTIVSGQIHAKQLELYMDAMDVTNEDVYCDKTRAEPGAVESFV